MPVSVILVDPAGAGVEPVAGEIRNVVHYVGEGFVPQDVMRRRALNLETMRRMGNPVVVKHMYNDEDVQAGVAKRSPIYDNIYAQTRHDDPLSYGIGYVSVEDSENEWYDPQTGDITIAEDSPGDGWLRAPLYRGFGPGYLTYVIEPDTAEDLFKLTETGAMIRVQNAKAQAPWFPEINDNDLLVNVILDAEGNVLETKERFQAKMSNPTTMRGLNRRGRRELLEDGGNRFPVGQEFEMALIPSNDALQRVPIDR